MSNLNDVPHSSLPGLINATRWSRAESFRADPVSIVEALTTADRDELLVTLLRHIWSPMQNGEGLNDHPRRVFSECNDAAESVVTFLVEREAV
jgi:hypothetical protein